MQLASRHAALGDPDPSSLGGQGAVGSEFKIDASYVSPNERTPVLHGICQNSNSSLTSATEVSIASSVERCTQAQNCHVSSG